MSPTWMSETAPVAPALTVRARLRAVARGIPLAFVVLGGLLVLLILRCVERPLHGMARPWTPHITVFVCRQALRLLGLACLHHGQPMRHAGVMVANHSSWLDIFVLNSGGPLYFVSKEEVAAWPVIGWLARATGTVFLRRRSREAGAQRTVFEERLAAGHKLLFFPEGTSTDGQRVLGFKSTLFAALFSETVPDALWVQPVTVAYHAPDGTDHRFYGWWGDMDFAPHLVQCLAQSPQGRVDVTWHAPLKVSGHGDRKALAKASEAAVRASHPKGSA